MTLLHPIFYYGQTSQLQFHYKHMAEHPDILQFSPMKRQPYAKNHLSKTYAPRQRASLEVNQPAD